MSYAMARALQAGVFARLSADAALEALVGGHVYDALPAGALPGLYVSLGPERVVDAGDKAGAGAWHDFVVSVVSSAAGFDGAKAAAGAVSDALVDADLALARGRLVGLWFRKAQAARQGDGLRRIDLTFRARVEDEDGSIAR